MSETTVKVSLEPLTAAHAVAMAELETVCFSLPWSVAMIEQELSHDYTYYWAGMEAARLVGYAGMQVILDEGYITNVAVHPDRRRSGIGVMLIQRLLEQAVELSLSFLTLEVRQSNAPAIELYKRFKFEVVGTRPNYYTKPTENALLMTRRIP